jgi:transposase-like protein
LIQQTEVRMSGKRRQHGASFKAKVAVEAVREIKTLSELSAEYQVHPTLIGQWKKQLLEGAEELFSGPRRRSTADGEALVNALYREVGRLQMELEWLKKGASAGGRRR